MRAVIPSVSAGLRCECLESDLGLNTDTGPA